MDEESKSSTRSEESIPNPVYEEILGTANKALKNVFNNDKENNSDRSTPQQHDETTGGAETDDESDDEGSSASGSSSNCSDSHDSSDGDRTSPTTQTSCGSSNSIMEAKKNNKNISKNDQIPCNEQTLISNDKNTDDKSSPSENIKGIKNSNSNISSTSQMKNVTKIITSIKSDNSKSPNIKLLLKKPQGYEFSSASGTTGTGISIKMKTPTSIPTTAATKPVFLVTVVSNTPTGPTYSTATYSPAGTSQAQFLKQVASNNSSDVKITPNVTSDTEDSSPKRSNEKENNNKSDLSIRRLESVETVEASIVEETIGVNNGKSIENVNEEKTMSDKTSETAASREELDDNDSIKSDLDTTEIKTSTPKIGRELMQLQKTVSESKVLTEYINDSAITKSRKSRKLVSSNKRNSDSEYSPVTPGRSSRRSRSQSSSKTRIDSPSQDTIDDPSPPPGGKWASEERINKRMNMRSQNSEFMQKHIRFLNRVNNADADTDNSDGEVQSIETKSNPPIESQLDILKKNYLPPPKRGWDPFCWKCTTCGDLIACSKCVRSYHLKCLKSQAPSKIDKDWVCPECYSVESFIKGMLRSGKTALSMEHLNQLMQFALKRMRQLKGNENFFECIDENEFKEYDKFIINPVTLETMQKKIESRSYRCSEELISEAKWMQHNAIIYYGTNNKTTNLAKQIVKVCRQEANEIETCPECYYNANTRKDWFVQVCSKPHILLWAKLKGFPYWPAKSMGVSSTLVNVRFFGAHDRAHVPLKDCFLYSEKDPNPTTKQNKRNLIAGSIVEVNIHIRKIIAKFGVFKSAPFKTLYNPLKELTQLEMMIPGVSEYMKNVQALPKPALTFKIVKTADNNLSMIKKTDVNGKLLNLNTKNEKNLDGNISAPAKLIYTISNEALVSSSENEQKQMSSSSSSSTSSLPAKNAITIHRKINDETIKTYEVVAKKDEKDTTNKVSCVILKRKSDNWNAVMTSNKKHKSSTDDNGSDFEKVETLQKNQKNESKTAEKRKLSIDKDIIVESHAQKPKLDEENNERASSNSTSSGTMATEKSKSSSTAAHTNDCNEEETFTIRISSSKTNGKRIVLHHANENNHRNSEKHKSYQTKSSSTVENKNNEKKILEKVDIKIEMNTEEKTNDGEFINLKENENARIDTVDDQSKSDENQSKNKQQDKYVAKDSQAPLRNVKENNSQKDKNTNETSSISRETNSGVDITEKESAAPSQQNDVSLNNSKNSANSKSSSEKILVNVQHVTKACFLKPISEIKTEKPDTDDEPVQKDSSNVTPEFVDVKQKSATSESTSASETRTVTQNTEKKTSNASVTAKNLSNHMVQPIIIKTEVCSDDEDPLQPSLKTFVANKSNSNSMSSGDVQQQTNCQRLVVRDFASMRAQPLVKRIEKKTSNSTSKLDLKKRNQRARKSFPNRSNFSTSSLYPLQVIAPKPIPTSKQTSNNVVYIPLSSKNLTPIQKTVSIPSLTVVTKTISVSNQSNQQQQSSTGQIYVALGETNNSCSGLNNGTTKTSLTTNSGLQTPITIPIVTSSTTINTNNQQSNQSTNSNQEQQSGSEHMLSGFVTSNLAAAITDTIVRGPPKLAAKPTGPLRSDGDHLFPTEAGPVCKTLMENAHKMTDFFRTVIEDTLTDMSNSGVLEAKVQLLELELEKLKHSHNKELSELKQNTDLMLCEMKNSLENEKQRLISETRKQCEIERIRAVEEAKKKQWCVNCGKEAQFYCCWNTSYCDYPCQQKHWLKHMNSCAQNNNPETSAQKVGVKIQQISVKDKSNKPKEIQLPKLPPNTFLRPASLTAQSQRNAVPFQRLVSMPVQRFALNREGNWEMINHSKNYQNQQQQRTILPASTSAIIQEINSQHNNISGNGCIGKSNVNVTITEKNSTSLTSSNSAPQLLTDAVRRQILINNLK